MLVAVIALLIQQPAMESQRDKAADALENARGVKFEKLIPVRTGERKEYGVNAVENAKLLYGDDLAAAGRALKALGLIGGRIRLDLAIPTLAMAGRVQAFYRNGELVLVDTETPQDELVYKLALALADQRFKTRETAAKLGTNFDAQMAWAALQHGDADMCKQLLWAGKKGGDKMPEGHLKRLSDGADKWEREDSKWASTVAPRLFVRASDFIWRRGGIFMETLRQAGGMEAVDKAFGGAPTTEQILHPEKFGKDLPASIDLKALDEFMTGKNWKRAYRTTLGELGTAVFFETHLKEGFEKAAPGWGGDTLAFYENEAGRGIAVWATTWDTADDAAEFQAAAQRVSAVFPVAKDAYNYVIRRGTSVVFVFGITKEIEDALLEALWKAPVKKDGNEVPLGKE